jgi:hypothetical protein
MPAGSRTCSHNAYPFNYYYYYFIEGIGMPSRKKPNRFQNTKYLTTKVQRMSNVKIKVIMK